MGVCIWATIYMKANYLIELQGFNKRPCQILRCCRAAGHDQGQCKGLGLGFKVEALGVSQKGRDPPALSRTIGYW